MSNKSSNSRRERVSSNRDYKEILFQIENDVAWITINRPEVLNAFREQTLDELTDAVSSVVRAAGML